MLNPYLSWSVSTSEMHLIATIFLLYFATLSGIVGVSGNVTTIYRSPRDGKEFSIALLAEEDSIVVGGRDFFSQLRFSKSAPNFNVVESNHTVDVVADADARDECLNYYEEVACSNIIRVLQSVSTNQMLVCGTNAQVPKCFYYNMKTNQTDVVELYANEWLIETENPKTYMCDSDSSNRSFYVTSQESSIRSFKRILPKKLITPDDWFRDAEFKAIYEFSKREFVYVLFSEQSTYFTGEEFTKGRSQRYSMIGRACKNDDGGSYSTFWVTLNKLRLLCPWPGTGAKDGANFYYDELVASFQSGSIIYGLFRPNRDWKLSMYAIAKYDVAKIDEYFDGVAFDDNRVQYYDKNNPQRPAKYTGAPPPFLPGQCPSSVPYKLSDEFEVFVKGHTLVRAFAKPIDNAPFYVGDDDVNYEYVFVREFNESSSVFLLSREGRMKKLVVRNDGSVTEIFQKRVIDNEVPIRNAKIVDKKDSIVAVTSDTILSLPLSYCEERQDCESCVQDPHCHWKADRNNSAFSCVRLTDFNQRVERTCFAIPESPTNLQANVVQEQVQVSWETRYTSQSTFHLITVVFKKTNEIIRKQKTTSPYFAIDESELNAGLVYEVRVATLHGNALSKDARKTFHLDLTEPTINVEQFGSIIAIAWPPVVGASKYKVQSYDYERTVLQKVSYYAVDSKQTFFQPYTDSEEYTVIVTAESDDLVNSTNTVVIVPQTTTAGTTSTAIPLPIETQPQNTSVATQPSTNHTTVTTQPTTTTTAATTAASTTTPTTLPTTSLSRLTTTLSDEEIYDGKAFKTPSPNYSSRDDKGVFPIRKECHGYLGGLFVFVLLFSIALGILIYNNFGVIKSNSGILRDNNNSEYRRHCFIIWSKRDEKYQPTPDFKFDDAVVTSSHA